MRSFPFLPWLLGLATLLGVVAIVGIVTRNVQQTRTLLDDATRVSTTIEVQRQLDEILLRTTEAETGQRGYVLTGDEDYLRTYRQAAAAIPRSIERLSQLTSGSPAQGQRIGALRHAVDAKLSELARAVDRRDDGGLIAAVNLVRTDEGQRQMDAIRRIVAEMESEEGVRLEASRDDAQAAYQRALVGRVGSGVLSGLLLVGLALLAIMLGRVRERNARQIADEREHLSVTLSSIGDGVIATDVRGRVTLINSVAEDLTGWRSPEALGRGVHEVFTTVDEESGAPADSLIAQVLEGRASQKTTARRVLVALDGRERPIDDSAAPIRAGGGAIQGAVLVFRDVTSRRAHEAALAESEQRYRDAAAAAQAAMADAEEANRLKDEFLAVLSHELRTPLNAVLGWTQILVGAENNPATLTRGLAAIKRNAEAQQRLVEDLLDVSRIVTGKFPIERKPTVLRGVLASVVDAIGPMAASKGVGLHASLTDSAIVNADAYRLQQVASNLLSNAIKFTPAGGEVHVTLSQRDDQAVLVVQDTGQGIAPELLPHIFDRFRQGDGSSTRAHGGLGLGLAIVRHIVRAHEGAIEAHSDGVNRGATFTVALPLMDGVAATSLIGARGAFDGRTSAKLSGLLALIVDDEPDSRDVLSCALQEAGADVVVAADGLEALALLMAHQPNVLLTDVQMPQMDGFALLAAVRERLQAGAPPAIAITARASTDDALRAAEAGFAAHLTKPVDLNLLMDTIRRVSGAV